MNGTGCNAHRLSDGRIGITAWLPEAHGETRMQQWPLLVNDALALTPDQVRGDLSRMVREDVMKG